MNNILHNVVNLPSKVHCIWRSFGLVLIFFFDGLRAETVELAKPTLEPAKPTPNQLCQHQNQLS
jgi:hypothetical protein